MEVPDGDEEEEFTNTSYDMKELMKGVQGLVMSTLIVGAMHFKWKYNMPLIMSSCMQLVNVFDNALLHVHVLGNTTLKRPFKANR
eukprot:UN01136